MKKIKYIITTVLILANCQFLFSQKNSVFNKTYIGYYTADNNDNFHLDKFYIKITQDEIFYTKNNSTKNFYIKDLGITSFIDNDAKFYFHKFLLTRSKTYMYISYTKMMKYQNKNYYVMILDGQKMLVL